MLTFLLDDVGIPRSYRYMHGNSVHAYKWINAKGQQVLVKSHWECLQGEQSLMDNEAILQYFSFATFDLYNATQTGNYPQWKLQVQMMPVQETYPNLDFDPLDSTREWPLDRFPYIDVGILTINATGHDFYENEQSAFAPSRFINGIAASNDKMLQARLFSYPDAQRYRLGINNQLLPVNAPRVVYYPPEVDGHMNFLTVKDNQHVNYFPSNYSNLVEAPTVPYDNFTVSGTPQRTVITKIDDYLQPRLRYLNFTSARQHRFATRIAERLVGVDPNLVNFWINTWGKVDPLLAVAIKKILSSDFKYKFDQKK
jgi:catalase